MSKSGSRQTGRGRAPVTGFPSIAGVKDELATAASYLTQPIQSLRWLKNHNAKYTNDINAVQNNIRDLQDFIITFQNDVSVDISPNDLMTRISTYASQVDVIAQRVNRLDAQITGEFRPGSVTRGERANRFSSIRAFLSSTKASLGKVMP